jgi:hypothetical protein
MALIGSVQDVDRSIALAVSFAIAFVLLESRFLVATAVVVAEGPNPLRALRKVAYGSPVAAPTRRRLRPSARLMDNSIVRSRTLISAAVAAAKLLETGELEARLAVLELAVGSARDQAQPSDRGLLGG